MNYVSKAESYGGVNRGESASGVLAERLAGVVVGLGWKSLLMENQIQKKAGLRRPKGVRDKLVIIQKSIR
ncbi:MAG: hypothetical protein ACRETA_03710 [Gammaproteobacteria bacterium]